MAPKRHHTVPRMLLSRFAPPDRPGQVWQIAAHGEDPPRLVSCRDAAVIAYFYTLYRDRDHKADDPSWEELLAEWESRAADVLDELLDHKRMRGPIGALIELQIMRSPLGQALLADEVWEERRHAFGSGDDRDWTRWYTLRKGRIPDLEEWKVLREAADAVRRGEVPPLLKADTTAVLDQMSAAIVGSGFSERLQAGHWNVLEDEHGHFVIGDVAVTYCGPGDPVRPVWRQATLPVQTTMPISSMACLEVRRDPRAARSPGLLSRDEINAINRRAFEWATRWVFGPDPDVLGRARVDHRRTGREDPPPKPVHPRRVR